MPSFSTLANKAQQSAIETTEGPVLIIAGPGSGKTFALVERIVHLIQNHGAAPESLFVVTFTDKAARELTTRISNRLNSLGIKFNLNEMYVGTFHSICLRLLDEHREFTRLKRNYTVMDQFDQQYFLYQRLNDYRAIADSELVMGKEASRWSQSQELVKWLNKVTEEALDPKVLEAAIDPEVRTLAACYNLYLRQLDEANALDFSTIQLEALHLLEKNTGILSAVRAQLTYLMVDEYQDTNTIQERILRCLLNEKQNLCVVGDDDQGLYRFRGATIRNILEFPMQFDHGSCKQVKLTTNYRSHPDIIEFYNRWMQGQQWQVGEKKFRFDKQIEPRDEAFPTVPAVIRVSGNEAKHWNDEVLAFLNRLNDSGQLSDWNQVAFLFRSVRHERVVGLAEHLERNGIPVYSPRSDMYFMREEIRLMIGALIFLFPQFPEVRKGKGDFELEIWKYYDQDCLPLLISELKKPESAALLAWMRTAAKRHFHLTQNADYAFSGLFYDLLRFPIFSRYLSEEAMAGVDKGRAARNLAMFSSLLSKFEYLHHVSVLNPEYLDRNIQQLFNQFLRFLQQGGINEYEDDAEYAPSGCISFLTVHQSKGLEFPVVMVGSLEAVPRKQFTKLDEILESGYLSKPPFEPLEHTKLFDFRRLFYTAFSRAQNLLVLTCQEKEGRGKTPSKYFDEYYKGLPSWKDVRFRPEDMTFELVKEINLKREYSFTSHITLYENCSEQYRFFKELEFSPIRVSPMLFGTLVHQTIEDIHKTVLRGEEKKVTPEQIETWFSTNYTLLSKRERVYLAPSSQRAALGHIMRYFEREKGNWDRIREAEVEISLVKDHYILKGSVDLIRGENDTVEIVDFKSEKKPDMEKDKDRLRQYQHQLEVYAHLVEQRTGQKVSRMHLYYTGVEDGVPTITFEKDDRTIAKTIKEFDDIVDRIERKDYSMTCRPTKMCVECDMRGYCDNKNWTFRT